MPRARCAATGKGNGGDVRRGVARITNQRTPLHGLALSELMRKAQRMRFTVCLALAWAAFASGRPVAAQSNGALSFDGQDDCVMVPYDASFPTETFSAGAWIKVPQPTMGNSAVIGRGEDDDSFNFAWQLYLNPQGRLQLTL